MRPIAALVCVVLAACGAESSVLEPPPAELPPENLQWAELGQVCSADAPAVPLSDAARDSLGPAPDFANTDQLMADLARQVPGGWGGNFRVNGVFTVYLVDTTALAAARAALANGWFPVPANAVAKKGRWDFAQLHDWYRHLLVGVSGRGVTMTDIQEAENRIHLYVRNESARAGLEAHLRSRGAVCNLVAIGVRGPAIAL